LYSYAVRVFAACEQLWGISIKISETGFGNVRKFHEILLVFFHTQVMSRLRSSTPSDNHYTARLRAGGSPHGSPWRAVNATTGKFIASIAAEVKLHSYIILIVTN